jgi:hypothetical protein
MQRMPLPLTLSLLLIASATGAATLTARPRPASAQATGYAYDGQGATIAVRPLDDPANPYRGQYGELEPWLLEHAETYEQWRARTTAELAAQRAALPDPKAPLTFRDRSVMLFVTPEGWVKPSQASPFNNLGSEAVVPGTPAEEINRYAGRLPDSQPQQTFYLIAPESALPAPLLSQRQEAQERAQIKDWPLIPAWLGTRPPLRTIFVPNGDIVVEGPLNRHYATAPWAEGSPSLTGPRAPVGETWYRYTRDGQQLAQFQPPPDHSLNWFKLFWPDMEQAINMYRPDGHNLAVSYSQLWVGWTDPRSIRNIEDPVPVVNVYAAWDYSGRPLALDKPMPAELIQTREADQYAIAELYALQLKYGVTGADTLSPYEGTAQGPVVVDPAPLPWPRTAHKNYGPGEIRVLAQDDPANQYRGQYSVWDRWIWQQFGARDPRQPLFYAPGDKRLGGTYVNFFETWRNVFVPVDDNGAQVPLAVVGQWDAQRQLGWDRRDPSNHVWKSGNYSMSAAGELDWAQWTQLTAERLGNTLGLYPQAPAWLLMQPVSHVTFVPNGDVVTHGPLGSFDTSPELDLMERYKAGRDAPYHIYGADGALKATLPLRSTGGWTRRYWPADLATKIDAWQAEGKDVETVDGYTLVFSGPRYGRDEKGNGYKLDPPPRLLAAFDWDGRELDITQPLTRPDYHCLSLEWHEIRDVAAVQALVDK